MSRLLCVKRKIFYLVVIFLSCILCDSCSQNARFLKDNPITKEEERAELFLSELLFKEGACYTLLGDKPVTSMLIFRGDPANSSFENLSLKSIESLSFVESNTYENYEAWKTLSEGLTSDYFFFVELPAFNDPSCSILYFVNISEMKKTIEQNLELFQKEINASSSEILAEFQKPNKELWRAVFKDHYLAGLLYGYGKNNCIQFCKQKDERIFSERFEGIPTKERFPIPVYAISKDDEVSQKYKAQRKKIKALFKNGSALDLTLKKLDFRQLN